MRHFRLPNVALACSFVLSSSCAHHSVRQTYQQYPQTASDPSGIIPESTLTELNAHFNACSIKLRDARELDLKYRDRKWSVSAVGGTVASITGFASATTGTGGAAADLSSLGYASLGSGIITLIGGVYAIWGVNADRAQAAADQSVELTNFDGRMKEALNKFDLATVTASQLDLAIPTAKAEALSLVIPAYDVLRRAARDCAGYEMKIVPKSRQRAEEKVTPELLVNVSALEAPEIHSGLFSVVGVKGGTVSDAYPELAPLPTYAPDGTPIP